MRAGRWWLSLTLLLGAQGAAAGDPEYCLALRGNGYKVPVTLAAMARLTEEFGVADAVLGTSSGSIAAFLYESILSNPAVGRCGDGPCSDAERARRVALALKSMLGFADALRSTRSGRTVDRISGRLDAGRGPGPGNLWAVLTDPALAGLLNRRALLPSVAVLNPLNWRAHRRRLGAAAGATNFGAAVDFELFLREGLLDLPQLVTLIGRAADFYANLRPDLTADWQRFFSHCATPQRGVGWPGIAVRPVAPGLNCGSAFTALVERFEAEAWPVQRRVRYPNGRRRVIEERPIEPRSLERTVGSRHPTLATVAFVAGDAVFADFVRDKRRYDRFAEVDTLRRDWLDAFRIAYFGQPDTLARVAANARGYADVKTDRFHAAGAERWGEVMMRSIGEPGLQAARPYRTPLGTRGVTAGGWVDNFAVPPLKNLGCRKVVFVTRQGADANFASGVARGLGADDDFVRRLFSQQRDGAFGLALAEADAILCTDWDRFKGPLNSPLELARHGYESPLVTRDHWFRERASAQLPLATEYLHDGCRPPKAAPVSSGLSGSDPAPSPR